jgi:hypothetical protein
VKIIIIIIIIENFSCLISSFILYHVVLIYIDYYVNLQELIIKVVVPLPIVMEILFISKMHPDGQSWGNKSIQLNMMSTTIGCFCCHEMNPEN